MVATQETIDTLEEATGKYKYGFVTDIESETLSGWPSPTDSDEKIKVTRDEMKGYFKKLLRALILPGGVQRLLAKNKTA